MFFLTLGWLSFPLFSHKIWWNALPLLILEINCIKFNKWTLYYWLWFHRINILLIQSSLMICNKIKKQSLFKSIYFILVNLETCLSERLKNYLFKLFQGDLPVAISINHFHVRLNVLFSRFVNLPHFLISLLKNERYLILSQISWSIFIKLLEKSSYNIQTFLGQWCQISSFNILWTLGCDRKGTFVLILR